MSSTRQQGEAQDFYETPAWCVHRLLDELGGCVLDPFNGRPGPSDRFLEPAFGRGAIVNAVAEWARWNGYLVPEWTTVDVIERTPCPNHAISFFSLGLDIVGNHGVVVTNPPFRRALEFAQRCLDCAPIVCMLLRAGWLGSDERAEWIRKHTPSVYMLPDRPSFRGGGTDSDYYAWMVWGLDDEPRFCLLGSTPKSERTRGADWSPSPQLKLDVSG